MLGISAHQVTKGVVIEVSVILIKENYLIVDRGGAADSGYLVMELRHSSLSIYPDGVWWNIHYSGVLKCRSWVTPFLDGKL